MDLTEALNTGREPFREYSGSIPKTVPAIRADGREFAGGPVVLEELLRTLQSKDQKRIQPFEDNYIDLADASLTFEDLWKGQPNSPLLRGIRGVVETEDGLYVAVDVAAVNAAIKRGSMKYFADQRSENETVRYTRDGETVKEQASDVVLLPYNGRSAKLTADQFQAVKGRPVKRESMEYDRDLAQDEIVKDDKVVHPAWKIYPAEAIVPLIAGGQNADGEDFEGVFAHNKRRFGFDTNSGLYLPGQPENDAEMRALYLGRLDGRSGLNGGYDLGDNDRLLGVVEGAAGATQKLTPTERDLLRIAGTQPAVAQIGGQSYVRAAEPVQPKA